MVQPQRTDETFEMIGPGHNYESVTEKISSVVLSRRISVLWLALVLVFAHIAGLFGLGAVMTLFWGVGTWGNNIPVGWAFGIINFVWWIGIGHAGTLISAILLLLHQNWRTSINRFAEAMTLFAVFCAAQYPLFHIGRHMYAYWMFPVPNSMGLWPQFKSPLIWDVFAINTYLLVSALFWFVGLIPDLATLRDRARTKPAKIIYGMLAMGWRGSALHWRRYTALYLLLAGLSTPLVLSVHTIVSFDFAFGNVPGWHTTIFPPYFVAGAVFAGFAMVLILAIPLRAAFHLRDVITMKHLENCAKVMLATGMIVVYGYIMEVFFGWYSGSEYERYMTFVTRMNLNESPYAWSWYALLICNGLAIQPLWFKKVRTNPLALFVISLFVSVGMWLERFVIIVTSLTRDFLPAAWGNYSPTWVDWALYIGTIGLFFTLFLLFIRLLPAISIAEMRELVAHHGHGTASFTEHGTEEMADARLVEEHPTNKF
ncbi:MAG: polysulfide reductase NrfD [Armatimonadetes bacterium]|nr:polysulfide reductase NrfD [Armatimonadota bacterium]